MCSKLAKCVKVNATGMPEDTKKCSKPRTKSPNKVQKCYEKCVSGLGIGRQERQGAPLFKRTGKKTLIKQNEKPPFSVHHFTSPS